jgi:hypothetical protein
MHLRDFERPGGDFSGQEGFGRGVPGSERSSLLTDERVLVERDSGGGFEPLMEGVAAHFDTVSVGDLVSAGGDLSKPMAWVWMLPWEAVRAGDRVLRSDGERWLVRTSPLRLVSLGHVVVLVERI